MFLWITLLTDIPKAQSKRFKTHRSIKLSTDYQN